MNILIAADSFKDALPATEVCHAIASGVQAALPHSNTRISPMADGGEGTFEVLAGALGMQKVDMLVMDPLLRPIPSTYGRSADGKTAFIEMAKSAGLQLLKPAARNPLFTSSYGVGEQIKDAVERGAEHIILAIGGSATNDAGIGMASALGWCFLDERGAALPPVGQNLVQIASIVPPKIQFNPKVQVICDVTNPLFGPTGAALVYARQKGADDLAIEHLEHGLRHFAEIVAQTRSAPDPFSPGAGAAGGMGFGTLYFLQAELKPGADLVFDLLDFDENLRWADIVVTGEGKIDAQTAQGKLIHRLCSRAALHNTPVIALCGRLDAGPEQIHAIGLQAAYSINESLPAVNLAQMLAQTAVNLRRSAKRVFSKTT